MTWAPLRGVAGMPGASPALRWAVQAFSVPSLGESEHRELRVKTADLPDQP